MMAKYQKSRYLLRTKNFHPYRYWLLNNLLPNYCSTKAIKQPIKKFNHNYYSLTSNIRAGIFNDLYKAL